MLRKFALFVVIWGSISLRAQNQERKNLITVNPASILFNFRYEMGFVAQLNDPWMVGLQLGYGSQSMSPYQLELNNYSSFSIRPELFYNIFPDKKVKQFVSVQPFYISTKGDYDHSHYYIDDKYYDFESADFAKDKIGFNLNYGIKVNFGHSRFGFIPKAGFGYCYVNNKYTNVINQEASLPPPDDFSTEMGNWRSGSHSRLSLNFELNLFYQF